MPMTTPAWLSSQLAVNVLDARSLLVAAAVGALAGSQCGYLIGLRAGGALSVGLTLAGYVLGSSIPNVDRCLLPLVALIVAVSLIPLGVELSRSRRHAKAEEAGG